MATRPPIEPIVRERPVKVEEALASVRTRVESLDREAEAAKWPEKSRERIKQKFEQLPRVFAQVQRKMSGREIPKATADRITALSLAIEQGRRPVMAANELNHILRGLLARRQPWRGRTSAARLQRS